MKTTLRFVILLLAWNCLGRTVAWAQTTTTLSFADANYSGSWISRAATGVPSGSTVTTVSSAYNATGSGTTYVAGSIADGNYSFDTGTLNSATLRWTVNYPQTGSNKTSSVTFTFNRAVSNFKVQVQDIDKNDANGTTYIDQVVFAGANGATAVAPTVTPSSAIAATINPSNTATANTVNLTSANDYVVASFGSPITSLTITYKNTTGATDPAAQGIGIDKMTWDRALPTANNITNAALASTADQTTISALSGTVDGGTISYTITQIPPVNQGVLYYNTTGTTYAAVAAGQALTAAQAASLKFDPAETFSGGNVAFNYTSKDNDNQTSAAATFTIPIQAVAVAGNCGVSYFDNTKSYSGLSAEYFSGNFNDNLSYFASNTAKLSRVDATINFAASNSFGNLVSEGVTTVGSDANPDQFSARYRGSIYIGTAGTYSFDLNSDEASYMWIDGDALLAIPDVNKAIVNNGGSHVARTAPTKVSVPLSVGLHNILIFYGENTGGNSVVFSYFSGPGVTQGTVVPSSVLCAGKSNLPPVAVNVANTTTIPRNAAQRTISALNATDADGNVASYKIVTLPTSGTLYYQDASGTYVAATAGQVLTVAQAGSLRFMPNGTTVGNVTFTFSATDNSGMESNASATYTIPVTDVVVTASNDSYEVPKNTAVTGNVLLNDNDPNNTKLTTTKLTNPTYGTVVVNANGTYTYTPATDYLGPDSFTYQVTNTAGQTATATVNLRVYDTGSACTSSTGQNLLTNFDFSQGNTGFSNDYNYISPAANAALTGGTKGLNPEGNYAVDVNATTYHNAFRGYDYDNTNADGTTKSTTPAAANKFLMINGSASIQRMYAQTVTVQKNRYYTFSAYFNNLLPPGSNSAVPEVGFVINGSSVSSTLVLNESPDRWVRYSSVWYSGDNTTAVFEIRNVSTAAGGNDLGIDQLYFGTCNLPPVANNDLQTTLPNTAKTFSVTANDTDGDGGINVASVNLDPSSATRQTIFMVANKGTFTVNNNGDVTFTPITGFTGTVSIPYTVQDVDGALSNPGTISVTVQSPPTDLTTTITASAANVDAGQTLTYTVTARNNGPSTATQVVETLQLPAGLTDGGNAVTFTINGAASTVPTYNNTTGLVTFPTVASLNSGGSTIYGITVKAPGAGPITATAGISAANTDINLANNAASVSTVINPRYDVTTTITGPTSVVIGNLATYTVTTKNVTTSGALSAAPNVRQTVTLPKNLVDVYVSNGGTYDAASGIVSFPVLASLPLGQTAVNTISFTAPATGFTAAATVVGSYTAAGTSNNVGDVATGNNTQNATATTVTTATGTPATATTNQTGTVANLATTISTTTPSVAPGASVTLKVDIVNNGPSAATSVVEQVSLLPGLTVSGLPAGASYDATTGVVTFGTIASLTSAATQSYSFQFTAPTAGYVLAAASVSSATTDPVAADNVASTMVMVTPTTDVTTALAGPASALAGQVVNYTVTTANASGAAANGVVQTVRLPAGLSDVTVTGGGTYDAATGVVTFALGTLPSGSKLVNSVSFGAPSTGSYSPTASVSTTTPESNTANNRAAVTTTVSGSNDVAISVSGPVATPVFGAATYQVVTTNNGPNTAESVVPTLQLPAGLTIITLPTDATYSSATGLVTFATISNLANGASSVSSITVRMPEVAQLTGLAQATVGGTVADRNLDNNRSTFTTSSTRESDKTADLRVTLTSSAATVTAGQPITLTAVFSSNVNNQDPATNVATRLSLPIGLTGVVVSNGGTYNSATGLVTWPVIASLASPTATTTSSFTYTVQLNAPGLATLAATASIASDIADSNPANNAATASVNITAQTDVTTLVSGPAAVVPGSAVTYSVVTLNNGPSPAANVVQKVTLPTGVTASNITNGSQSGNVITFNTITSQAAGAAGAVTNTFTITAPAANYSVQGNVTTTSTESDATNNQRTTNTAILNLAPYAQNVVNAMQAPEGNTAGQMLISPLAATDAETAAASLTYAIDPASLPTAAQGVLYYSNGSTYVALPTTGTAVVLTAAQAASLKFDPAAGFTGNAFFSYTATDGAGNVSNAALYTIAVGKDIDSYYKATPTKGGNNNQYQNNDVLTYLIDNNGARYVTSGTTALIYDATTGALLAGASNGLAATGANAVLASGSSLNTTQLAAIGVGLNPTTGQLVVSDRTKLRAGTYSVSITTTDVNGGTNTVVESFTIGASPLPVELVSFDVKAVKADAVLTWSTASEKNNDRFEVERSFDGRTFVQVGTVAGNGSTSQTHSYSLTDLGVGARYQGTVYYRLKQVDTDGTTQYSPVRTVAFTTEVIAKAGLYPNPATTTTKLDLTTLPTGVYQVSILDMAGRSVGTYTVNGGIATALDVSLLPLGNYVVVVQGTTERHVLRLTKQ